MTVDCAIFTMSLGFTEPDPFARFVPGWYATIAAMDPAPAEVCIACPPGDASGAATPPQEFPIPVTVVRVDGYNPTDFMQAAVRACHTKWVSWAGLDDRVLPAALTDIPSADAAGAELLVGKYQSGSGGSVIGEWNPAALATSGRNDMAANSPFTREAFERVGGWPDIHFHDWGLWLRLARAGVKTFATNHVGMVQDLGHHHVTRSGVQMPGDLRRTAMAEIRVLVDQLWRGVQR